MLRLNGRGSGGIVDEERRRLAGRLREAGVRRRAEQTYQQLDFLMGIRKETRKELLAESRKHPARKLLEQIPRLGPIRVALLIALMQTPNQLVTASMRVGEISPWKKRHRAGQASERCCAKLDIH